jgi:DNA-binding transcriptional LysR family regulator
MIPGRLLNQFIAVAEELHFARAAARLHMAQPPLSQAIKNLEEMVGVQLLARSKHSVSLTPAGSAFLEEARELIAHGQRAIDMARRASEGLTGRITIPNTLNSRLPQRGVPTISPPVCIRCFLF